MTKTSRNPAAATESSFHKHYAAIWGEDRWHNSLYPALAERTRQCALVNKYAPWSSFLACVEEVCEFQQLEQISFLQSPTDSSDNPDGFACFTHKSPTIDGEDIADEATNKRNELALPQPRLASASSSSQRHMTHWNLDAASVLAASLLNVQPSDAVLDLCAAPGGKSLALAQKIWPQLHAQDHKSTPPTGQMKIGHLTSNESDPARYKRLTENLKAYLPAQLFNSNHVRASNIDSTESLAVRKLSLGAAGYDKVLVDAPCSSERHIIHAHLAAKAAGRVAAEIANWRPGSSKRLAKTQVDLLMTGLRAARIGGRVVYATCSIEMGENDGVVEKVLKEVEKEVKKGGKWSVKVGFEGGVGNAELEGILERRWAERTKFGWIVLPDHPSGGRWGPLFFLVLTKISIP